VHDHQEALGLAALDSDSPEVLHTLHWDVAKHPELYGDVDGNGRVFVNGGLIQPAHHSTAALRTLSVGHAHLATPAGRAGSSPPGPPRAATSACSAESP
jgi:hypothetical protein